MKKYIIFAITGIMCCSILMTNFAFSATPENWIDFAEPPEMPMPGIYEVYTAEQLAWIAKRTNEGYSFNEEEVLLCADIDLGGREWTPIGAVYCDMLPVYDGTLLDYSNSYLIDYLLQICFSASFNGNGYKISNMHVTDSELMTLGLFGVLRDACITNIDIVDCELFGYISEYDEDTDESYAGALAAGIFASNIVQCRSTGTVSGYTVGGLVGVAMEETNISQCNFIGTVFGDYYVGGLVGGTMEETNILQSYFIGTVSGDRFVGGLVGASNATISQCYTEGTISSENWAGGLVGTQGGIMKNCYSEADVIDDWRSVGLIGLSWYGYVESCYWSGAVSKYPLIGPYENDANSDYTRIVDIYWDAEKSGLSESSEDRGFGTPLTTAEFKAGLPHGFDPDIWGIIPGSTYPYLKAFGDNIFTLKATQTDDNTVEIEISGDVSDCVLVGALYDPDNRMLEVKIQPASSKSIEFSQPIAYNTYRIFILSDMERLIPVSVLN